MENVNANEESEMQRSGWGHRVEAGVGTVAVVFPDRMNGLGTRKVTSNDTLETHLHNYEINCTSLRGKPSLLPRHRRSASSPAPYCGFSFTRV